jgi:AcrR family transcriptional regulator
MSTGPPRQPRSDARNNRRRLLAAAQDAFAARGLDVPMTEIAERAGVGVATLYRHFPAKSDLFSEVFQSQVADCVDMIDQALADSDPWRGFTGVIEKLSAMQAADRGLAEVFLAAIPDPEPFEAERIRLENAFAELARRAKAAGRLRPDFVRDDLTLVIMASRGISADTPEEAEAASRRLAAYLVQAFQAAPEHRPLPPVPRLGPHPALRRLRGPRGNPLAPHRPIA